METDYATKRKTTGANFRNYPTKVSGTKKKDAVGVVYVYLIALFHIMRENFVFFYQKQMFRVEIIFPVKVVKLQFSKRPFQQWCFNLY